MSGDVEVGLIGYGLAGRVFHAPFIARTAGLRLAAVSTTRADEVGEEFPDVIVAADAEAILDNPEIGLVVIAAPNAVHFSLAEAALARGKHVVVDKPITPSSAQARRLDVLARERGVFLSAFQNRRWDGDFLTIRALLADGALGKAARFESGFDRFRPHVQDRWRERPGPASGVFWDLGPHLIDQAVQLFGRPHAVRARILAERPGALVDDAFEISLRFAEVEAVLFSSCLAERPRPRFTVTGQAARFVSQNVDPQEEALRAGLRPGAPGWALHQSPGRLISGRSETEVPIQSGDYGRYYAAVAAAITAGGENPVPAAQAAHVIEIIEAAERSARDGAEIALT